ncbi:hypothetical protein mO043L [Vaccinia virus]|uniref:Uncharacterized 7.5 kDa protein n=3 Tax=Vaccinia virus TaxID=10245 RepID=Y7K5_VACCW|nr:RecName: Full=Uncharacterized 7.5 kDa protein [Vaccinia virus WR]AAW23436.1 hypothetical protein m8043L [Vaccinia virus]AAW23718.1 hypothetical protein mO043L [Vaccinia virus]ABZ79948.1 hypothetical protein GL048 [synthetic Vaccinia virus]BAA00294.1 ORF8 [Vaccinia virus]
MDFCKIDVVVSFAHSFDNLINFINTIVPYSDIIELHQFLVQSSTTGNIFVKHYNMISPRNIFIY